MERRSDYIAALTGTFPNRAQFGREPTAPDCWASRRGHGKSGDVVAAALHWSPSKISRYELARTGLKLREVEKLLDYYEVSGSRRTLLLTLAKDASLKGWWEEYADFISPGYAQF